MGITVKSILKIVSIAATFAVCSPATQTFAFGDEPPPPSIEMEAAAKSGCLRWNWQQYSWYDHCPTIVRPKAYMYPRSRRVLRVKG
jgi:hypothetical protein